MLHVRTGGGAGLAKRFLAGTAHYRAACAAGDTEGRSRRGKHRGPALPGPPAHPGAAAQMRLPLAAPSANPSGAPSPKTAAEVLGYFEGKIEAVIDGGACGTGLESTIIDLTHAPYRILRQARCRSGT